MTALDDRYVRAIPTSGTNPGGTGGSLDHNHPFGAHTHTGHSHGHGGGGTSGTPSGTSRATQAGNNHSENVHTHAYTFSSATADTSGAFTGITNWDTVTVNPDNIRIIFIKSDGSPTGFPYLSVAFFNAAAPTNWNQYTSGRWFWKGMTTAGDGGATTAGGTHTHPSQNHTHSNGAGHTHAVSLANEGGNDNNSLGVGGSITQSPHTHTGTTGSIAAPYSGTAAPTSSSGDMTPPWKKSLMIQNISGANAYTKGVIAMWDGTLATIPEGWYLCDGTNGTPSLIDVFVVPAANTGEIGNTGGALTHTHAAAAAHTHSIGNHQHGAGTSNAGGGGGIAQAGADGIDSHTHTFGATASDGSGTSGSSNVDASANSSNVPTFTTVAYIQFVNKAPNAPTINVPVAGTAYSGSLTLDATVSDPDNDTVFAEFQYDRNDGNWVTIGNGTTVASGGNSTRNWDISTFQPGFNYRVRARANDGGSLNNVSAYTTSATFIIGPGFARLYAAPDNGTFHSTSLYAATVKARGPLVYWRLNDYVAGASSGMKDYSGNALYGDYTFNGVSVPGPADDEASATSVNGYGVLGLASRAHHALFNLAAPFSIEFWIKLNAYHDDYSTNPIYKWTNTTDANYVVYLFGTQGHTQTPGQVALYANAGGVWQAICQLSAQLSLRAWHHIVFTYHATDGGRTFVDAVEQTPAITYKGALATNSQVVGIQGDATAMSEVAIYHTAALTPTQILENFTAAQRSFPYRAVLS